MRSPENIEALLPEIERFCEKWGIVEFALFGSILREDVPPESDVDVLVTLSQVTDLSLFDWVDMQEELRGIFKRDVDIVSRTGLRNPFRRHEILRTQEVIYAAPGS